MKKYPLIFIAFSAILFSCSSEVKKMTGSRRPPSATVIYHSSDIAKALDAFKFCFNHDTANIRKLYTDSAIFFDNLVPVPINKLIKDCSPREYTGQITKLDSAYFIQEIDYHFPVKGYNKWVQIWGYRVTTLEDKTVQRVAMHCNFALIDGKIIREYDYYDPWVPFVKEQKY